MAQTGAADAQARTFRLIYRSHSLLPAQRRDVDLAAIFSEARSKNKDAGITGALLLTDHYFVQALEGDEATVRSLYQRICGDSRHDDITLLESGDVGGRAFARWAMAQVSAAGGADIPLQAVDGQVQVAAGRPVTREQSAVLTVMRNSIGADTV